MGSTGQVCQTCQKEIMPLPQEDFQKIEEENLPRPFYGPVFFWWQNWTKTLEEKLQKSYCIERDIIFLDWEVKYC